MSSVSVCWVNGIEHAPQLPIADRGLNYGQALFETLLATNGRCHAVDWHLQRLYEGAEAFAIALPAQAQLKEWLAQAAQFENEVVVKCLVTAGDGPRGYATPQNGAAKVVITAISKAEMPATLNVITASHRLYPSAFSHLKHCHKMPQVLAKDEAVAEGVHDAIMLDVDGYIIEGTSSNILAWSGSEWVTPALRSAGLSGTALGRIRSQLTVLERELTEAELAQMPEIYFTNAVTGAVPVERWQHRRYTASKHADVLAALKATQWDLCISRAEFG